MKEVYKIDQIQLSRLAVLGSLSFLCSFGIYQAFFKKNELRTNTYIAQTIIFGSMFIDLWQVYRCNLEYGISDYMVICFSSVVVSTVTDALTFLPIMVMV